jgi:hypothetical protein
MNNLQMLRIGRMLKEAKPILITEVTISDVVIDPVTNAGTSTTTMRPLIRHAAPYIPPSRRDSIRAGKSGSVRFFGGSPDRAILFHAPRR